MRVEVVLAWPRRHVLTALELADGATVADALAAAELAMPALATPDVVAVAIHGQRAELRTPLRDGDRVELLRPLQLDPREARRRRAERGG